MLSNSMHNYYATNLNDIAGAIDIFKNTQI